MGKRRMVGLRHVMAVFLAVTVGLGGLAPITAGATSYGPAQYWQHIGYSFEPCELIALRPNLDAARQPATMRALLVEAIEIWNDAVGRATFVLGADTSRKASARFDGVNTVEFQSSSSGGLGGAGGPSSGERGGVTRITEADVEIYDFDGLPLDQQVRDILLLTLVHEIGHGIGFLHTVDPDSPMSYTSEPGPTMDVDTALIARQLLGAPCGSYPQVHNPNDIYDNFARAKDVDFSHVSRTVQPLLPTEVAGVIDAGVSLAHRRLDESEPVRRAVVCRADLFPDCLAASSLAGSDGIIVFVAGGSNGTLSPEVRNVVARALQGQASPEVIIVGGPNAVSTAVEDALAADGYPLRRLADGAASPDRYGTAVAIASAVLARTSDPSTILIARGDNPADAMTAGVIAARDQLPLVLTPPGALSPKTRQFLQSVGATRIVILGGPAAVADSVKVELRKLAPTVDRLWGRERTATSVAIARDLGGYTSIEQYARPLTLLNGRGQHAWALALGFASLGAVMDSPILLTEPDGYLPATVAEPAVGAAPGSGRFLADLDLDVNHDGGSYGNPEVFFQLLGTESGGFTPRTALRYADQALLYCRWYRDDCSQRGLV